MTFPGREGTNAFVASSLRGLDSALQQYIARRIAMLRFAVIAVGLGLSAANVYAQNPPASPNTTVVVRGCVSPVQRDGSLAAKAGATATVNTTTDEANNPVPTGVFMLLDATQGTAASTTPAPSASNASPQPPRNAYSLSGHEGELTKLNGYRVEITGTVVPTIGDGLPQRTDVAADGVQRVRVASVKRIAGTCSASKK